MNVLLVQVDGKLPNIALMRIAAHHRDRGDTVRLIRGVNVPKLFEKWDLVYASAIFERSRPALQILYGECRSGIKPGPNVIVGGTGVADSPTIEFYGITTRKQDYSIYPDFRPSIGFTQRGCRLKCSFCLVPAKEGAVREENTIADIWRGDPWPRELHLLDNDFFGQPNWRARIAEIQDGGFKVSFNQGINARFLTDEAAEALASVDYRDDSMKVRRIYTAWDNRKDKERLFEGLRRLVKYGVKPDHMMVYMLLGYCHRHRVSATQCACPDADSPADRELRRAELRAFGCRPYPMPYVRTPELVGFQRWVIGAYDKRITWNDWKANNYRPEGLKTVDVAAETLFS